MQRQLHIYLDETGSFDRGDERCAIGGFYTSRAPSAGDVDAFWRDVLGAVPERFHATDHRDEELGPLVVRAVEGMEARGWTPVMFEHLTRAWIRDNATTYAYVMADGLVRLGRLCPHDPRSPLQMCVHAAWRTLPGEDGTSLHRMMRPEYESRIDDRLAFEKARSSAHRNELDWTWRIDFDSGTGSPYLWVADLMCNAWRRMKRLPGEARERLRDFLAPHTIPVLQGDDQERILLQLGRQEYGLAILDLLALARENPHERGLQGTRHKVVASLAQLDARTLETALTIPLYWVEQLVEARKADEAEKSLKLLEDLVLADLETLLPATRRGELDPIRGRGVMLEVTSANHRGAVVRAEAALRRFTPLRAKLSRQFERLPLVVQSQFTEAVHRSNTYDFGWTLSTMERLGETLRTLIELFGEAIDEADVRSDAVGRALGTALQAACQGARRDAALHAKARALSEQALAQFTVDGDRRRQHGYRCQIETDAGDLQAALAHLRTSLGIDPSAAVDAVVAAAVEQPWFNVMHVARIWEAAARLDQTPLARELQAAWAKAELPSHPHWTTRQPHPQGVTLWKWGAALGYAGSTSAALQRLDQAVAFLEQERDDVTLRTLALGARADRLALQVEGGRPKYEQQRGELEACHAKLVADDMPASQRAWFAPWKATFEAARAEREPSKLQALWRRLAWEVPY